MKKVKFVIGTDIEDLNNALNDYLKTIPETETEIKYDVANLLVIVEHGEVSKSVCRCCDCQHYDPSEDNRGAWGLCHRKGIRTKFSSLSCNDYDDIRC